MPDSFVTIKKTGHLKREYSHQFCNIKKEEEK